MTEIEKYEFFKKAYPKATDIELQTMAKEFQVLESGLSGAMITKKVLEFGKSFFTKRTAAAKAAKKAAGWSTKKKVLVGAAASGTVLGIGELASNNQNPIDATNTAAEQQAADSYATAIAQADANGIPIEQFISGPTGTQLGLSTNNIADFMTSRGFAAPAIGGIGVFTGVVNTTNALRRKYGGTLTTTKNEVVGLADWKKSFPVDALGITSAKQKFVDAGVLDPTADITQVKSAWDTYGQLSLDYARAGNTISPWQLLDIQKGLTGGAGGTTTTRDESLMAKSDIRSITKQQLSQSLGLADIDDESFKQILKIVRRKEAKNPTITTRTTTGNTSVTKTKQGYGRSDVAADAEEWAKQDPRYADFQTANVFGNALIGALGLKA
tara:strand:+ start:1481 stop:2629 length:1149 start_codon:yes stop_codon:yes gene_type:complete